MKPIWVMVEIPKDAAGTVRGSVEVCDRGSGEKRSLPFEIEVKGDVLEDGGIGDAWRLARLKWLDSNIGREDTVTKPYADVAVDEARRTVKILGRELVLGEDGLPARIISHFSGSNARIVEKGTDLLAAPLSLSCRAAPARQDVAKDSEGNHFAFTEKTPAGAAWEARTPLGGGAVRVVEGRIDFAGECRLRVRVEGAKSSDAVFEMKMPADVARYMEGFGRNGGAFGEETVTHAWKPELNRDAVWLGRGDPFKGLLFGMTDRDGWGGSPAGLWRFFDETGLGDMELVGWWDDDCPVKLSGDGSGDLKASVWKGDGRAVLVVANFSKQHRSAEFSFDGAKLGFDGAKAAWTRPAIAGVQKAALAPDFSKPVEVPAGGGFILVAP